MATTDTSAATYVINSATASPVSMVNVWKQGLNPATFMVNVSSGASLTYNVEITADDIAHPKYNPATGNWFPITGFAGQTASVTGVLSGACRGIRVNVTTYGSGTLTYSFCQLNRS